MNSYFIFAIVLTVAYIIYYAVIIAHDIYGKKGTDKPNEEVFDLGAPEEEESVAVTESETGFSIGSENYETESTATSSETSPEEDVKDKQGTAQEKLERLKAEAEEQMEDVPGEAVFTSGNVSEMSGAKLQKEQTRAQNKETLLEIINNANISDTQKQEAVNSMITMTDIAEKETAAEILLEAKGFSDAVVSIDGDSVDVVVNTEELTEAQRAQIEDIVIRKTGVSADSIIISTVNAN